MALKVNKGRRQKPPRILLYGLEGIGKTTFASQAEKAIFLPVEDGLGGIECDSLDQPADFEDAQRLLTDLCTEQHDYQTLVIDSMSAMERMIHDYLCRSSGVNTIDKVDGGYGKGYTSARREMQDIVAACDWLRDNKGMAIVLIAHTDVSKFNDPETLSYDQYHPRLHEKCRNLLCEWADMILFATTSIITKTEDGGFNKTRTIAAQLGNERILKCVGSPSRIAKNRYNLPSEIPLEWSALINAMSGQPANETEPEAKPKTKSKPETTTQNEDNF